MARREEAQPDLFAAAGPAAPEAGHPALREARPLLAALLLAVVRASRRPDPGGGTEVRHEQDHG